ncbi:MAG: MAPEG family protein [Pseudomonadota bacterium]
MTFPIIATGLGAGLIILQYLLMLNVGMHRFATSVGVGSGTDQHLERKVRRHGNLAENAALFLVMLGFVEAYGAPDNVVIGFAAAFGVARLLHAIGFSSLDGSHNPEAKNKFFLMARAIGAFGTAFSGLGLGGYALYLMRDLVI